MTSHILWKGLACGALLLSVAISLACTPTDQTVATDSAHTAVPQPSKTLTIGLTASITSLSPILGTTRGGISQTVEIHSVSLVAVDAAGTLEPRLAAQMPSLRDGSLVVLPNGTMQTTWKLRADARWHDGTPVTADDMVFGAEAYLNPDLALGQRANIARTDRVEAIDAHTVRIYWNGIYYQPLVLGPRELAPLPAHLLRDAYTSERERFPSLPYWTTEYVHLGPFRLVEFGMGERLTFERFDRYFQGRPHLDRVILQVIGDPNTLYANLLAGTVDVAAGQTLSADQVLQLRREWQQTGGGRVFSRSNTLEFLFIQFHPERGAPPEIARDPRIRRGFFQGLDRPTLVEAFYPGFGLVADTFLPTADARNPIVGMPYARYRFDREAALRTFADAGWVRDGSGRPARQDGRPIEVTVRADAARIARLAVLADGWRQLGMTVNEEITPPTQQLARDYRASFSFVDWSSRGIDEILRILTRAAIPTPQNNWNGTNYGSYSNPRFDLVADRFFASVDQAEQASILKEVGEIFTSDWPILPVQYGVVFTAARQGIHTVGDGKDSSLDEWNAHLWAKGE